MYTLTSQENIHLITGPVDYNLLIWGEVSFSATVPHRSSILFDITLPPKITPSSPKTDHTVQPTTHTIPSTATASTEPQENPSSPTTGPSSKQTTPHSPT